MTGNANEELTFVAPDRTRHDVAPVAALGYQMKGTSRLWSAA